MFSQPDISCLHNQLIIRYQYRSYIFIIVKPPKKMIQSNNPDNLQIKQIDKNNRGLFTKIQFKPWSTVLNCQPISVSVSLSCRKKFCNFCLLEKDVLRCSQCKVVYYCSQQCQRSDWKPHRVQCLALKRMSEKKLDPTKINMQMQLNLRLWVLRHKNQQINAHINEMCNLLQFQLPEKLAQFQQTAVALLQMLQVERNEENMKKIIEQQSAVSLNSFTIQDYLCNESSVGLGLYYPGNFINHHCQPNCSQIFDGRNLKIVANRKIEVGEEITISYVPALDSWTNKQKLLRQGYLFQCFCEICQTNKMFDQSLLYLKCPACGNCNIVDHSKKKIKLVKKQGEEGEGEDEEKKKISKIQCLKCNKIFNEKQLNQIIEKANNYLGIIESSDKGYEFIKKALLSLRKLLSDHDPRMKSCIDKVYTESLNQAQKDQKIYQESYILLKEMLELVPKWYRLSPEDQIPYVYVWRYAELGKIAYFLQKMKKACEYTEKAYQIIEKIKFKNNFPEVSELKQRHQQIKVGLSFNKAEIFRK